jgi:rhodanese-related sulfurtransferase
MMRRAIWLLGLAVITALVVNFLSPNGIALIGDWDTQKGTISAKAKNDVVTHEREIGDIGVAKQLYDEGRAVFVDARPPDRYLEGHIAGAVSLPTGEIDALIGEFRDKYDLNSHIITYCSGRECDDSHRIAEVLADIGYTKVQVFVDGFPAWKDKGYPIE